MFNKNETDINLSSTPLPTYPKGEGVGVSAGDGSIVKSSSAAPFSVPKGAGAGTGTDLIPYLKGLCKIEQEAGKVGSLRKSYLYNFNSSNKYKIYKLFTIIFNIIDYFFGTFYCVISKPVLLFSPSPFDGGKKLTISINYYIPTRSYRLTRRHI